MVRRVLVLMLIAKVAFAQAPSDDGSAEGLLRNGFVSFNSGDYERSAAIFSDFMESYGSASEAQQYFERVQRMLSFSYLKLKDYDSAQDPVKVYLETFPDGEAVEELSFWQCVLSLKSNDIDTALAQIDAFIQKYPKNDNLPELRLMQLIANIGEQKYDEVLKLYPIAEPTLNGSIRYQAMTLALFAEIQSQLYDEALVRVKVFPVTADDLDQISGFHLLALDLGSRLLEEGRHRDALVSLQRAWSRNRILSRQAVRLEQLEEDLATAEKARVPDELEVLRLKDVIARVNKELSQLESMELYDTALQFRIAECFFQLKRLRESFLVIRGMLNELPDSELLIHGNYRMLLCLTQMERWEEAIESAVNFEERFPDSKLRPNVIYLMGESEMRRKDFQSAAAVFARLVSSYPDFQEVERCHFLHGYCLMMTEAHTDAVEVFDQFLSQRGQSDFKSEVTYWKAMAFHYLKEWEQSREAHGLYLDTYPDGKYRTDSELRRANALFGQKDYRAAYKELEAFLGEYPDSMQFDEASNLLGDCYFAMGEVERGIEAYRMTREINPKLFDYAYFRIGKAFKALEEFDEMESHYRQFLTIREGSPRLTEALSHLAWLKRRDGEKEEAAQLYWEAIHNYGNDPEAQAVEEMFRILAKFYRGDEGKAQYLSLLTELEAKAGNQSQKTLVARAIWMQAQLSEVERADGLLARLPDVVQKRELSPILLADTGDALRRLGQGDEARECYRTILSWYPRSLFKDRSFAGLGLLARSSGQDAEALDYFDQFERETVQSPLWAKVLEARAEIYIDQGKWEKAIEEWSRILEVKSAKGLPWVEALYQIGATYQKYDQPKKAIPYYQRIYVLYRRWDQFVAKAYLESGQAFEALRMTDEARNTYKEFLENTHLKEKPEYQQAETRLASLGGAS